MNETEILSHGDLKLNIPARKLIISDNCILLRNKEFSLLEYFLKNVGKVVSRTEILEEVWDRNICCSTNTVDVHVSSLRRKIRTYLKFDPIKTIYCIGYVFET